METIVPSRESATRHPKPEWFSGPVYVHPLIDGNEPADLEILAVYFDAGSRTKPDRSARATRRS